MKILSCMRNRIALSPFALLTESTMIGQGFVSVLLLLFCIYSGIPEIHGCNSRGPEDCDFQYYSTRLRTYASTFCSWTSDGGVNPYFFKDKPRNDFAGLDNDKKFGQLTSREACSTEGQTFCLKFKYNIRESETTLSVNIKYEGSDETEAPVWIVSSSTGWDDAHVPIKTHDDFSVVFKARRVSEQPTRLQPVFIDDIEYEKYACDLFPHKAKPPSITRTSTSLPTKTSTVPTTTSTPVTEATTSAVSTAITTGDMTNESSTTEAESQHLSEDSAEPSYKIGLIVGVVAAVVVIIAIALVLFFLLRHNNLEFWKRCFKREQHKVNRDIIASHNTIYDIATEEESHYANEADVSHMKRSQAHRLESEVSAETSDYYSAVSFQDEMQSPYESEAPQYAVVHKPGKTRKGASPKSHSKTSCTTAATKCERPCYSARSEVEYSNVPFGTESQNSHGTTTASTNVNAYDNNTTLCHTLDTEAAAEDNSVYYIPEGNKAVVSKAQCDVYNSLDFDGKGFTKERHGDASGTVYSHLNGSAEGTYNEVDRQKRADVIDCEYSHIT